MLKLKAYDSVVESQENKVVFTEMDAFVRGLELVEDSHKPDTEDLLVDANEENSVNETKKDIDVVEDEFIHEAPIGKGLYGALQYIRKLCILNERKEWGGRDTDKKRSKLVGCVEDDDADHERFKDIRIERRDEFGRIMTPKESFRKLSHAFHGKGPGKKKQEKRQKQYQKEMKLKNPDTPSQSVERMRNLQAQLKTPYLVLDDNAETKTDKW